MSSVTNSSIALKGRRGRYFRGLSPFSYGVLLFIAFLSFFPFYWMFVVASNGQDVIAKVPPAIVPGHNFMHEFQAVLDVVPFGRTMFNTLAIALVIAFAQVFLSALAGFAFAKLRFPGQKFLVVFVVGTMMLPSQLGLVPLFMLMNKLNWINDFKALIVPAIVTAFGVFWMRQVVDAQIPNELLEAARIDGAGIVRIFRSIVVPVILPSAFVLGLFSFLATWNDYLWPLLILNSPDHYTVQVALTQLNTQAYGVDYNIVMAGSFMATAPLVLLFVFVGRRLVAGVMDGAVKG
jgi:cellobiose transport system permease protein